MVAYLFAGQGSQYVGMGKDLYNNFPEARSVFDKAENILGFDLKRLCFEGPEDALSRTSISQPAIVTTSIAAFEAFKTKPGIAPSYMAGLSLGEYSALISSGSLSFEDGIRLIKIRGELMDEAAKKYPGKMVAVLDLDPEKIKEICLNTQAEIANFNCPRQIVISGKVESVERAADLCAKAGAKRVIMLEASGGFHSSLMLEASIKFRGALEKTGIKPPVVPVVSNYTAKLQVKPSEIIDNLVHQICSSVRWEDSIRLILSKGICNFIEFGPGKVLKGLMQRIDPGAQVVNIEKSTDITNLKS